MARRTAGIKGIRHDLGHGTEPIRILPLSDLHYGDPHADEGLIRELIDRIAQDPACYTILVGDLLNTAVVGGKSDAKAEKKRITEQLVEMAELLSPIKDKILAAVPGNHEERAYKIADIDLTELLMTMLGKSELYRPTSALVFIRAGRHPRGGKITYSLYINHGHGGGGRRAGSKLNNLEDLGFIIDTDIIIAGHSHLPGSFRKSKLRVSPQTFSAEQQEQVFVNLASALHYGGYGERGGYQPPSNRYPVIELDGTRKDIRVIF